MAGEIDGPRLEPPSGQVKRLVVFLHGYGADGNDLIDVGRAWQSILPDTAFVSPKSKAQIIAASPLAGGGETVTVEFTAPAAGKYQFICTFPAHFQAGMVGQLIVE